MTDAEQPHPQQPPPPSETPHSEAVRLTLAALEAEWGMDVPEPMPPPLEEEPDATNAKEEPS